MVSRVVAVRCSRIDKRSSTPGRSLTRFFPIISISWKQHVARDTTKLAATHSQIIPEDVCIVATANLTIDFLRFQTVFFFYVLHVHFIFPALYQAPLRRIEEKHREEESNTKIASTLFTTRRKKNPVCKQSGLRPLKRKNAMLSCALH